MKVWLVQNACDHETWGFVCVGVTAHAARMAALADARSGLATWPPPSHLDWRPADLERFPELARSVGAETAKVGTEHYILTEIEAVEA